MLRSVRLLIAAATVALSATPGLAQISLTTAVDLALRNSPRVRMAQADVDRGRANLSELRDVYIPSIVGGSGLGYSYGFPLGQPTIFNFGAQSLVFSFSQRSYIRSARAGLEAANISLIDARQTVIEETTLAYLTLSHDMDRRAALLSEQGYANRLVTIVSDRVDAGQDTPIDLTTTRLTAAQIRLVLLHTQDDIAYGQDRLARVTGLPATGMIPVPESIPAIIAPKLSATSSDSPPDPPSIEAAFAAARSKLQVAKGDSKYLFRPQLGLGANYARFAKFNNYSDYYNGFNNLNSFGVGIQLTFPLFDMAHRAKARGSAAAARRAQSEAELAREQFRDGHFRAERSAVELSARTEVAGLDQQLAQQQIDVIQIQLDHPVSAIPVTPKEEQKSHIAEREKYLTLLDSRFQLQQAEITLLRQAGGLEQWIKSAAQTQSLSVPAPTQP